MSALTKFKPIMIEEPLSRHCEICRTTFDTRAQFEIGCAKCKQPAGRWDAVKSVWHRNE